MSILLLFPSPGKREVQDLREKWKNSLSPSYYTDMHLVAQRNLKILPAWFYAENILCCE